MIDEKQQLAEIEARRQALREQCHKMKRSELTEACVTAIEQRAEALYLIELIHTLAHNLGPKELEMACCAAGNYAAQAIATEGEAETIKGGVRGDLEVVGSLAREVLDTLALKLKSHDVKDLH